MLQLRWRKVHSLRPCPAVYIIGWWLFTQFEYVMFHHRIVSTRVVSDLQAKTHRF